MLQILNANYYIHNICVPYNPNILFHFLPLPALALDGLSSLTTAPYCLMQQVNALLLTAPTGIVVSMAVELESSSASASRLESVREMGAGDASFSSSLSKLGCSPAFRYGCGSDDCSSREGGGEGFRAAAVSCFKRAVLCSSRFPHSMQSCSLTARRASWSPRRLGVLMGIVRRMPLLTW
jgi:hypothetical protein